LKKSWRLVPIILAAVLALSIFAQPATAIQRGGPDGNDHPYVCMVVFYDYNPDLNHPVYGDFAPLWRTTGILISSRIVLTAAHGTDETDAACVWFESDINPESSTTTPFGQTQYPVYGGGASITGIPETNPDYRNTPATNAGLPGFDYHDVGIIVLDKDAPVTQYGVLPTTDLVDTLPMMQALDLVGYGVNYQVRGGGVSPRDSWKSYYERFYAPSTLIRQSGILSSEFLMLTANSGQGKGGTTFGDSGGPILQGGTNVILGLNSFVNNANCDGVTYAQRIDIPDILEWIESYLD
jgi:hypothetical protein